MPINVHDYRSDLTNICVQPQIRSRFRRVELGPVPDVHSHDLGGETFLVMEGQIEFTVADEHVVCQPGQTIYVPPRTTHAVRAVGEQPGVIYLSVSPHVEPTHTNYGADGQRLPPRYGVWRAAGGGEPRSTLPTRILLERYRAAAQSLAELARANTDQADNTVDAATGGGEIKPTVDQLWQSLKPVLLQVEALERDGTSSRCVRLIEVLDAFQPLSPDEASDVERIRQLASEGDPWPRSLPLHATGSAVVVHPPTRRVLLRWHHRVHAWLQVGGHGDAGETDPYVVALREAAEETGLRDLTPWPHRARPTLMQVVIVPVPARKREPAHEHADFRYGLATASPDAAAPESPSAQLKWLDLDEALATVAEDNLRICLLRIAEVLS